MYICMYVKYVRKIPLTLSRFELCYTLFYNVCFTIKNKGKLQSAELPSTRYLEMYKNKNITEELSKFDFQLNGQNRTH